MTEKNTEVQDDSLTVEGLVIASETVKLYDVLPSKVKDCAVAIASLAVDTLNVRKNTIRQFATALLAIIDHIKTVGTKKSNVAEEYGEQKKRFVTACRAIAFDNMGDLPLSEKKSQFAYVGTIISNIWQCAQIEEGKQAAAKLVTQLTSWAEGDFSVSIESARTKFNPPAETTPATPVERVAKALAAIVPEDMDAQFQGMILALFRFSIETMAMSRLDARKAIETALNAVTDTEVESWEKTAADKAVEDEKENAQADKMATARMKREDNKAAEVAA